VKKRIAVFGAAGSVGGAVTQRLEDEGREIFRIVHFEKEREKILRENPKIQCAFADVGNPHEMRRLSKRLEHGECFFDDVIYAVGKYGKGEYSYRLQHRPSTLPIETFENEVFAQFIGLFTVFQAMLPVVVDGGSFVFVSSVQHEDLMHDIISTEQQELLIEKMRDDETVKERGIKIHHLGFGPIDTHYYYGMNTIKTLPLHLVTKEIILTLENDFHVSLKKVPE
jgi:NAD(P)-dependent dehydrogenase (short-subunit alcohol dehydrogenase family)